MRAIPLPCYYTHKKRAEFERLSTTPGIKNPSKSGQIPLEGAPTPPTHPHPSSLVPSLQSTAEGNFLLPNLAEMPIGMGPSQALLPAGTQTLRTPHLSVSLCLKYGRAALTKAQRCWDVLGYLSKTDVAKPAKASSFHKGALCSRVCHSDLWMGEAGFVLLAKSLFIYMTNHDVVGFCSIY